MIAQTLAARRPDQVRALVLSNTAAKMGDADMWLDRVATVRKGGIEALADPLMERWFGAAFRVTDELTGWRNMLTRTPLEGSVGCCQAIAGTDLHTTTAALRLPLLAIGGSEDAASPPELVAATAALVPGSRFELIAGAGHLPCVETPEAHAALIARFIMETTDV
jgi:3-oxoadipate enol-lactonase